MLTTEKRLLDAAGRPRSPATFPGYHSGRPPRNKGLRYPADPPRVEEIVAVMRRAGNGIHGSRIRGLIVVLWRAGLRISEALDWPRRISIPSAAPFSCAAERAASDASPAWTIGVGSSFGHALPTGRGCPSGRCSA
jgi:hypothetical protein